MSDTFDINKLEVPLVASELTVLAKMVDEFQKLEGEIALHESQLKTLKGMFNQISQIDIPDFLVQFGLKEIKLIDDRKVKVKSDVSVTIKDYPAFILFLKQRHDDDIVKNSVEVLNPPRELIDQISEFELESHYEQKIHPATLKKYFRDFLEVGDTPPDCVSIYTYSKTSIK